MVESPEDYELFHYGVKGMKWGVIRDNLGSAASSAKSKTRARRAEYKKLKSTNRSRLATGSAAVAGAMVAKKVMTKAIINTPVGRNLVANNPVAALGLTAASTLLGGAAGSMAVNEIRMRNSDSKN